MRILTTQDAAEEDQAQEAGMRRALRFIQEDDVTVQLRTIGIEADARGEAPKDHRWLVYIVQGAATVSNGEYYEKVSTGNFVLFDAGEAPRYRTGADELTVLEVTWAHARAPRPAGQARAVAIPDERIAPETHKARGGVYMEI